MCHSVVHVMHLCPYLAICRCSDLSSYVLAVSAGTFETLYAVDSLVGRIDARDLRAAVGNLGEEVMWAPEMQELIDHAVEAYTREAEAGSTAAGGTSGGAARRPTRLDVTAFNRLFMGMQGLDL